MIRNSLLLVFCLLFRAPSHGCWAGEPVKESLAGFTKMLRDSDAKVRALAANQIGKLGASAAEAIPELVRGMHDTDKEVRFRCAVALRHIGPASTQALIGELSNKDAAVRSLAAYEIGDMFPWQMAARPALVNALRDTDEEVRINVLRALGRVGVGDSVSAVIDVLQHDGSERVRYSAIYCLGAIGQRADPAIPILAQILRDPKSGEPIYDTQTAFGVRWYDRAASFALAQIGGPALKELARVFRDKNLPQIKRLVATEYLSCDWCKATPIVPDLLAILNDPDKGIRLSAAQVLAQIVPRDTVAITALNAGLKDQDAAVRVYVATALYKATPNNPAIMATLIGCVQDKDGRLVAMIQLDSMGPAAQTATCALAEALTDKDQNNAVWAARALGSIGRGAAAAIPALRKAATEGSPGLQTIAAEAMNKIQCGR
jgi:HEAT repeat protein